MSVVFKPHERVDIVPGTNLKIIQNKNKFCYGMDAVLLSGFCDIKKNSTVVDLGTGTGIIPLLLYSRFDIKKIYALEIQKEVSEMSKRTIKLNELEDKIQILNIDLKKCFLVLKQQKYDVVISNPPYIKNGGGIINKKDNFSLSRHEIACKLEDVVKTASFLLKNGGKFFLVHRPNRFVDIVWLLRKYRLEPKLIRFVHPKVYQKPNLLLLKAVKGSKSELRFEKPLYVYNEDRTYTDEIYEIYKMNKENKNE